MTALSKAFSNINIHDDLPFGTPPHKHYSHSLSHRVRSESSRSQGISSLQNGLAEDQSDGFSTFSSTGDPLPDEVEDPNHVILDIRSEGDEYVAALRQLARVVAYRHGAEIETVLHRLMSLVSGGEQLQRQASVPGWMNWGLEKTTGQSDKLEASGAVHNHKRGLKHFRSQPQLGSGHSRHRHFSFAPGDDADISSQHQSTLTYRPPPLKLRDYSSSSGAETPGTEASFGKPASLSNEARRPSKIPSPLHEPSMARMRREDSGSSLLTTIHLEGAAQRESSSSSLQSVITAVHHDSRRTSRTTSNRSSANSASQPAGQRLTEQRNGLRNSAVVALAAARAAEGGNGRSSSTETGNEQRRQSKQEGSRIQAKRRIVSNVSARNKSENESSGCPVAGQAGNGVEHGS